MKKIILMTLVVLTTGWIFAQQTVYLGSTQPENYIPKEQPENQSRCTIGCPPEGIAEAEPCGEDLNGGCNMTIPAFESVNPGDIICGTLWAIDGTRDTDWFELILTDESQVILHADVEAFSYFGLIDADPTNPTCPVPGFVTFAYVGPCDPTTLDLGVLLPGTYWFWIGTNSYEGLPCDVNYTLEFEVIPQLQHIPVSNWALYFGILLMISFVVIRFRRIF